MLGAHLADGDAGSEAGGEPEDTFRRRLMVTCDGAGASHELIERLDTLTRRPGHHLIYSVG